MARIPIVQGNSVSLAPLPRERLRAYDATGGMDAVARGLGQTGQTLGAVAEEQDRLDEQLDNAGAKTLDVEARQQINGILSEYSTKTGLNAGTARPDVEKRLSEVRTAFAARATTPRMARMLTDSLEVQIGEAFGKITNHARAEIAAAEKTATQARAGSLAEAAIAATDATERQTKLGAALGEIARLGELNGDPPEVVAFAQMKAESGVHSSVIRNLIDSDNLDAAVEYENSNAGRMIDDDRSRVRKMMMDPLQSRQATADAAGIISGLPSPDAPAVAPAPGQAVTAGGAAPDRIFQALLMQESGNRAGAVGQPTEWGRAYGAGQVLDSTARGVAKKLGIAWRPELMRATSKEGHAYQVKIARGYFDEAVDKSGGDIRRALMYYHGGPDTKKWGPKTRAYVDNVMARVGGGSASVPPATARRWNVEDLYSRADAQAEAQGWSPERLARAKKEIDRVVDRDETLATRRERDAERSAYDAIDNLPDNRLTSMSQLPAEVRANLSPEARIRLESEIERNTRPEPMSANGDTAIELNVLAASNPQAFLAEDLRRYRNQMTPGEYESLRIQQARIQAKPQEQTPHSRLWGAINFYGRDVGVDMAAKRRGESDAKFKQRRQDGMALFSTMQVYLNALTEGKRQPTDAEVRQAFDNAILPVRGADGEQVERFRSTTAPRNGVGIPESAYNRIRDGLRARGLPADDRTITRVYLQGQ